MLIKSALASLLDLRTRQECRKKKRSISRIADRSYSSPSQSTLNDYNRLWKPLAGSPDPFYCSIYSEINGVESSLYVPEYVYYSVIEPTLNNRAFSLAYADKGFYGTLTGKGGVLPTLALKGISGVLYDPDDKPVSSDFCLADYLSVGENYVLKPATDSAGGRGVKLVKAVSTERIQVDNEVLSPDELRGLLRRTYRNNFVIQEKIEQHPWFSAFNETSVNTVRMMTLRMPSAESIVCLRSVLRFGMPGSIVDNQASGGLSCGIEEEGRVKDFCVDKYGRRTPVEAGGQFVPGYEQMKVAAVEIAQKYHYHRILGFDFCLNESGEIRLLEINTRNLEINFMQMNLGPLFREYTDEVIAFCSKGTRTVVLDWDISN